MASLLDLLRSLAPAWRRAAGERGTSRSWLGGRASPRRPPPHARLTIEPLEEREVLSSMTLRPPAPALGPALRQHAGVPRGGSRPAVAKADANDRFHVIYFNNQDNANEDYGNGWPTVQDAAYIAQQLCDIGFPKDRIYIHDVATNQQGRYVCGIGIQGVNPGGGGSKPARPIQGWQIRYFFPAPGQRVQQVDVCGGLVANRVVTSIIAQLELRYGKLPSQLSRYYRVVAKPYPGNIDVCGSDGLVHRR
jgi:hypothetical protein